MGPGMAAEGQSRTVHDELEMGLEARSWGGSHSLGSHDVANTTTRLRREFQPILLLKTADLI